MGFRMDKGEARSSGGGAVVATGSQPAQDPNEWEGKTAHYVRAGATGANDGSDWTNAYTNLPSSLSRDEVYYVADGSYGSYTFDDAASGTDRIYVVKATETDHGTDTGWSSTYGDGSATWTYWKFDAPGYYYLDGQVGAFASDLPGYVEHGFKVQNTGGTATKLLYFGDFGNHCTDITVRHVEASFLNTPNQSGAWFKSMDILYNLGTDGLTIQYCWIHDAGRTPLLSADAPTPNNLIEYSVIEKNNRAQEAEGYNPTEHSEVIALQSGCDLTFRYNVMRDWASTGGIILFDQNEFEAYGNVFTIDEFTGYSGDANGCINGRSAATNVVASVYNNTFVSINHHPDVLTFGSYSSSDVRNNLFYDVQDSGSGGVAIGGTHDYNWFYLSGTQSEANIENGTGDPFVDLANNNYRLAAATNAGDSTIGSEYNQDMDGNTRGSDGTWDRGAFEY